MTPLTTITKPRISSPQLLLMHIAWLLAIIGAHRTAAECAPRHWYNSDADACVPCTDCSAQDHEILMRPCQPHQDTVCGTIDDLAFEITLMNQRQSEQQHHHLQHHFGGGRHDMESPDTRRRSLGGGGGGGTWDWQPSSMAFAAIACVLFVVALVYILYQHAKQWRHMENMERRFDRDVEQLSAQLMHNIVDLRTIETSTASAAATNIAAAVTAASRHAPNQQQLLQHHTKRKPQSSLPSLPPPPSSSNRALTATAAALIVPASAVGGVGADLMPGEMRCVYLEQLLVGASPIRGNVYTEDTKPTRKPATSAAAAKKSMATNGGRSSSSSSHVGSGGGAISAMGLHRMQSAFGKK